ncbi:hypothetical protein [Actinomadura parmotrematis]|uniref:CHAD domain-containing protein n=1 Tax=Actinomadura parmotrematis TaxID=2864039 RepID=A0ABS7FNI0_9ACTN|nr:hypothetical protein [Actinomadura parmotrematis]MBW8481939.1 hypothetical protein [Actinomadura parmotrematis]
MTESGSGAAAPMSREGVDHALAGLRAEQDRVAAALLDLEGHDGYRLLSGAALTGETWRRWDEAGARVALLWRLFDAYRTVLDEAAALRAARPRPDAGTLARLTELLTGDAVETPGGDVPLERRTLLGPRRERVTLDEAVALMSAAFERVAEVVVAADDAWTALLVPLGEAEERWREAARLAHELAGARHPELDRLGRELSALGRTARTDPLSPDVDAARLARLRDGIEALRADLAGAVRLRDAYPERLAEVTAAVEEAAAAEAAALRGAALAHQKIDAAGLPELRPAAAALRDRLAALDGLRGSGRWADLAGRFAGLERAAAGARERAAEHLRLSGGLLDRRAELRGRLGAYKAKAGRLGLAEDEGLARLHERARDLLWTAPCDLRAATVALVRYQRAIQTAGARTGGAGQDEVGENEAATRR